MTEPDNKVGLLRMADQQLREGYERSLEHVQFSANDYYGKFSEEVRIGIVRRYGA
jgi:hypothetical protein